MSIFSKIFGIKKPEEHSEKSSSLKKASSVQTGIVAEKSVSGETQIPPLQGNYAKAVFLNAVKKPSPIKGKDEYVRYFLYECGIVDPAEYHKRMVDEGYLEQCSVAESLKTLKVDDLKEILSELKLSLSGKKDELIARIIESHDETVVNKYVSEKLYSISAKGEQFLDEHKDYIEIHRHKNWGVDWKEYDANKKTGYSFYDVMWGIFNSRLINAPRYGRSEYFCMYQLLKEEGKRKRALEMLLRVIYIDFSGTELLSYIEHYKSGFYTVKDMKECFESVVMMAPGVINQVNEYADVYEDTMVDRLYEWKLPVRLCGKVLFLEIVHSLLDGTYSEEDVEKKLRFLYEQKVDELTKNFK